MSKESSIKVELSPEAQARIQWHLESGEFASELEVIEEGLRLLGEKRIQFRDPIEVVRAQIAEGLADIERGDVYDGDEFFDELERADDSSPDR